MGSGWKHSMQSYMDCDKVAIEEYETCVKSKGYSLDEAILSYNGQVDLTYRIAVHGIEYIIKPTSGQIKYVPGENSTFSLSLNPSLFYGIAFADPHYKMFTHHPTAVPTSKMTLGPNSGINLLYLKVCTNCTIECDKAPKHCLEPTAINSPHSFEFMVSRIFSEVLIFLNQLMEEFTLMEVL